MRVVYFYLSTMKNAEDPQENPLTFEIFLKKYEDLLEKHIKLKEKINKSYNKTIWFIITIILAIGCIIVINNKNKLNIIENNDYTLLWASENGYIEVVKHLVSKIRVNIHVYNDSPLKLACENGHLETIKYLINHGADVNLALQFAAEYGHLNIVKYFNMKKDININYNNNALQLASENGHLDTVKYLISEIGANDDIALQKAYENEHTDIISYIQYNRWVNYMSNKVLNIFQY